MFRSALILPAIAALACAEPSLESLPEGSPKLDVSVSASGLPAGLHSVVLPLESIDVYLVDAPGEATVEPGAPVGGKWVSIASEGAVAVVEGRPGAVTARLGPGKFPPGRVSQFRLNFLENRAVRIERTDGTSCELDASDAPEASLRVARPFRARPLASGEKWSYALTLDLAQGLVADGRGCFTFAPVLAVAEVEKDAKKLPLR